MRKTLFVNILLPFPVKGYYTYRVPYDLNDEAHIGKRVIVQFGQKKIYTGLIRSIQETPPGNIQVKYILSILDVHPIVSELQFRFWEWMASYYCCAEGEVMNAALPSAMKLASESKIKLREGTEIDYSVLTEKEYLLLHTLEEKSVLTLSEASRSVELIKIFPLIHTLVEKGYIVTEEEVEEKYAPKLENYIRLVPVYREEESLKQMYDKLEKRAPGQLQVLIAYIHLSKWFSSSPKEVTRSELMNASQQAQNKLQALEKKGIFESYQQKVSRLSHVKASSDSGEIILNEKQAFALSQIQESFKEKQVTLLHGVTGSGKTEIYIKLMRDILEQGKQVLYLLPEIALTSQIINRLQKYFGTEVGVYHSRYNENERVEIWQRVAAFDESYKYEDRNTDKVQIKEASPEAKSYSIILGARSALFLPFSNLGLVIVDEEHDTSYKQYDPAPRYQARDASIYLASLHNAKTLLGSATPSIESYNNSLTGKYGFTELDERYGGLLMPRIEVINLKEETRKKQMKSIFSPQLLAGMTDALANEKQVILFQNRRGFSLRIQCENCGYIPECINCDVTLIYHKNANHLRCHYCGYTTKIPDRCPACNHTGMMMKGFGTEKIEEELSLFFPQARIARMDLDSTRSKAAYHRIISDFEDRRIDFLVGTQMVTKGLDFDHVSLVGILNADSIISFPDFRSFERAFQLMEQVAGRAGRKDQQGKVLIQTWNPNHQVIQYVIKHDFAGMYHAQLAERKQFNYPPFCRLIMLSLKHKDFTVLNKGASELAKMLRERFGNRILGPEYPPVTRVKNLFIKNILIKIEKNLPPQKAKEEVEIMITAFQASLQNKSIRVQIDVDPQ